MHLGTATSLFHQYFIDNMNNGDIRPPQKITVETYARKSKEREDLHLLPSESREGSQPPNDADIEENQDYKECEELNFVFGNPLVEVTKGILHLYKEK